MTTIIYDHPPNIEQIKLVFEIAGKPVLFAYGTALYNPLAISIPASLREHEETHCIRQLEIGVTNWWAKYLIDDQFRFDEELIAHRVEYLYTMRANTNRKHRRASLKGLALRLSGPLYGNMVTLEKAKRLIKQGTSR